MNLHSNEVVFNISVQIIGRGISPGKVDGVVSVSLGMPTLETHLIPNEVVTLCPAHFQEARAVPGRIYPWRRVELTPRPSEQAAVNWSKEGF